MARRGRASAGRGRAGGLAAVVALLVLVLAPWAVRPSAARAAGCGMADASASLARPARTTGDPGAACAAACELGAQLAPAPADAAAPPRRTASVVIYARSELRPEQTGPERGTPPPR